jgi:integrase
LFALAAVRDGRAHPFRNSYANDMALNGQTTIEELKQALGHKTTHTTEKHYSHWLKHRRNRLEKKKELAWESIRSTGAWWKG